MAPAICTMGWRLLQLENREITGSTGQIRRDPSLFSAKAKICSLSPSYRALCASPGQGSRRRLSRLGTAELIEATQAVGGFPDRLKSRAPSGHISDQELAFQNLSDAWLESSAF